jgi:hypothetical protein
MAVIPGMRSTADYAAGEINWPFMAEVARYEPFGTLPLTALMSGIKARPIQGPKITWRDQAYVTRELKVKGAGLAAGNTAGATQTLTVERNAALAPAGMMLKNMTTGEVLRVAADPTSDTSLSVIRGWGQITGSAVSAIAVDDYVIAYANASGQFTSPPSGSSQTPFENYNHTQIIRTPYGVSKTAEGTSFKDGNALTREAQQAAYDHAIECELAMTFGKRHDTLGSNTKALTTMGGILEFVQTNVHDFGGAATRDDILDWGKEVAKYGNIDPWCIGTSNAIARINAELEGYANYIMHQGESAYGYNITKLVMPNNVTWNILTHPLWNAMESMSNALLVLSTPDLERHPLEGSDTQTRDTTTPGQNATTEELYTEFTISVRREKNFGFFRNF